MGIHEFGRGSCLMTGCPCPKYKKKKKPAKPKKKYILLEVVEEKEFSSMGLKILLTQWLSGG
jgi:hypothetical protein